MTVGRSRTFFASMLAIAFAASLQASLADEWHTTSSLTGPSKYGENFQRYDYVNPDAPKGGAHDSVVVGTFDSFNPYI
ncbi:MAG: ABC transporter substrate-binding protein, partial [Mesorhizobium sp.]